MRMLSVRPLLVLSVLGEAALLLLDDQKSSRALIDELRARPRRAPPPRKFSVAEIEEGQRADGATVEYLNGDTFWTTASTLESVGHHEREVAVRLSTSEMEHRKRNRGRGDCFHGCSARSSNGRNSSRRGTSSRRRRHRLLRRRPAAGPGSTPRRRSRCA